ncbi:YtpI family protein [Peribacillus acanthi]|uniref:YtpI family protein n=1 Tax=Peribacillus acanthi TaxID=2171554 RepID=UPI000D3E0F77|nr:YtpI family protein [Peribacillus acanthi]
MPVFVIFIILAFAFYVYYKIKFFRTNLPMERKWVSAKSSIALGVFVSMFGLNQLFLYSGTVTYIVAAVFIIIGALSIYGGIKAYKFFLPHAIAEAEQAYKK